MPLHAIFYMAGAFLILLVLLDVFLTVLYARVGAGVISHRLACGMWWLFRCISKPFTLHRDAILSFCGPCSLVALVATWLFALIVGGAMIIQPQLGRGVVANNGETSQSFITAMYITGDAISTVGTSDFAPRTAPLRLFFTCMSLVGIAILTLTLTYFLEIYNALQARNTFAIKMHHATNDTGDAAEIICTTGAHGQFQAGYTHLAEMSAEMIQLFEAHHFYAVLLYFRFREPHYALSRIALLTLDTVSLIKSGLDDDEFGWLKESAAVSQLWRSTMHMLTELATVFLPGGLPDADKNLDPDDETKDRWRRRYLTALDRFRQANLRTIADEEQGAETYIALRTRWDRYIRAFAAHMAHPIDQIDRVGSDPARSERRSHFSKHLRAAG